MIGNNFEFYSDSNLFCSTFSEFRENEVQVEFLINIIRINLMPPKRGRKKNNNQDDDFGDDDKLESKWANLLQDNNEEGEGDAE